jgi:cytochrome c oxidase subunit IV
MLPVFICCNVFNTYTTLFTVAVYLSVYDLMHVNVMGSFMILCFKLSGSSWNLIQVAIIKYALTLMVYILILQGWPQCGLCKLHVTNSIRALCRYTRLKAAQEQCFKMSVTEEGFNNYLKLPSCSWINASKKPSNKEKIFYFISG